MTAEEYVAGQDRRAEDAAAWRDWLAEHRIDAIVEPTLPIVAPVRGHGYDEPFGDLDDLSLTHYWDWTGFPVVALPVRCRQPQRPAGERVADRRARRRVGPARVGRRAPGRARYGLADDRSRRRPGDRRPRAHRAARATATTRCRPSSASAARRYFKSDEPLPTVDDVAAYYRERELAAVLFTVDWESRSGIPPIPNEEILDAAAQNPDVIIPFVSVDPARPDAVERARALAAAGAQRVQVPPEPPGVLPGRPRASTRSTR